MNQNVCYNCGGEFVNRDGKLVCLYCGTIKPENVSGEELTLLYTAYQRLRLADFSDAEQEFDDIIRRHPNNAQAYWGRLLSKYGIKYEEDYDGSKVPSCYAASIESVFESSDYKKALELADEDNREVFREHAEYIERCRCDWIEEASREKPYDIFISYKDSDKEHGIKRTEDSYKMQNLYHQLKDKGYRVFFSHETLRSISGKKYEPYIFNALSTAKIMIVYGSKPEYINSTWVKNEWTRYLKRMRAGEKKNGSLLVAYEGFAPMELPGVLSSLQCFDAEEWTFYTELFRTIGQILAEKTEEIEPAPMANAVHNPSCKHKPVTIPANPPTCTKPGLSEGAYCELCGEELKKVTILPATGHRFGDWTVSKKATCTEDGEYERVCHCGARETKPIPARGGHIPKADWETVMEPVPGKAGLKAKKCVVCGAHVEEEKIPALPDLNIKYSEGLAYKVNEDGKTCSITGQGTCTDKDIVIPWEIDGYRVTSIGGRAFDSCSSLTSIKIPDSVTRIGDNAFKGCTSLASVVSPESVTSIGDYAFYGCKSLASVVIPESVTSISDSAFLGVGKVEVSSAHPNYCSIDGNLYSKDCKTLIHYDATNTATSFKIPESVTIIGSCAFYDCTSLASVVIPDSVTRIGGRAFCSCKSLASVVIPDSVTSIDWDAFSWCKSLASVVIPNSVTSIGWNAFNGCTSLASVVIPDSVTSIGWNAFKGCTSLASVVIPDSVTSIGNEAFYGCRSLASVVIGDSVTSIGDWAFCNCGSLASVVIPESVTSISDSAFLGVGKVEVSSANPNYRSIDGNL